MQHQPSFAHAEFARKKKVTRREKFLAETERVVPWARLVALIAPHYPKGARGRPPVDLERMLRVYFLKQWYGLADERWRTQSTTAKRCATSLALIWPRKPTLCPTRRRC